MRYPVTPDGRYFAVRGRLWRATNPSLTADQRRRLTRLLMRQRASIGQYQRSGDISAAQSARRKLHRTKVSLGERGRVWWRDGAPDYNRFLVKNTPYRRWYEGLEG